jgi:hypothetical protein
MDKLRRNKGEAPSAEYEGPTINGKPILGIETVQRWFKDACGVFLTEEAARPLARMLNDYALLEETWKNTPEFNRMRENNKSRQRVQRISVALAALQKDVPALIDDTVKIAPEHPGLGAVVNLRDAVNVLAPAFQKFLPKGRGRKPESWHGVIRRLGPMVKDAIKQSGGKRAGFGKATSPAVGIMQSALAYLGIETSPDAIVDAMRGRKKTGK